jgi:purine/pyrimidine-nucleoside phosphorylase
MPSTEFSNVSVTTKANVYFEGKVVSHTLRFPDGSKKTIGLVYPGSYHFSTDAAERMEIVAGSCTVKVQGAAAPMAYAAGSTFEVPAKSAFDIVVERGITEYICHFL